uniref:D-xylose 1-dehydrogenase (NADP(+), D-xylono-1,5-lactone-forming) n=1 Tax=Albugo laibachii Nc14 TaxID=890382 RepID=F0WHE5_9STRA|nr:dimeric dihydrodiol dehydrogenase putative [Albugo laibachii Nc14]|eukprot:CCA20664.1 dimeric dihydrodiol dehydrogenase putative [Albugo laibachii Nc14]
MTKVRWGILGCGKISSDFTTVLNQFTDSVVTACAARSLDRSEAFAKKHGIANYYDSYDKLCEDPGVDVVYIGTIHPRHIDQIKSALKNRKHVLVEKPMTLNKTQALEVKTLVDQSDCFFLEGVWTRFFPATRYVRCLLDEGAIGQVQFVTTCIGYAFSPDVKRIWDRSLGGGGLLDIGIYGLQYVTMAFGVEAKIESIVASGKLTDGGVDAYGSITIHYEGSRFATVQYSCLAKMNERVSIVGTKGVIEIHPEGHIPTKVTLSRKEPDTADGSTTSSTEFLLPTDDASKYEFEGSTGFKYEIEAVNDYLRQNKREASEFSWDDSILLQDIMDQVRHQIGVVYPEEEKLVSF